MLWLWLTSPAGWLPRTGISSGTLSSTIKYLYLFNVSYTRCEHHRERDGNGVTGPKTLQHWFDGSARNCPDISALVGVLHVSVPRFPCRLCCVLSTGHRGDRMATRGRLNGLAELRSQYRRVMKPPPRTNAWAESRFLCEQCTARSRSRARFQFVASLPQRRADAAAKQIWIGNCG